MKLRVLGINGNTPVVSIGGLTLAGVLQSVDQGRSQDAVVAVDLDRQALRAAKKAKALNQKAVLVRFEPAVVCPLNYDKRALRNFDSVIDVGRNFVESSGIEFWPQHWPSIKDEAVWLIEDRLNAACLVNANKLSFIPGELYSLRRDVIDAGLVDTYGHGWDMAINTRLKKFVIELMIAVRSSRGISLKAGRGWFRDRLATKGPIDDKLATMASYKVAVVIENSADYISEKLLDAIFAGCIPVYVGPDPIDWGLSESLYIKAEANFESIQSAIGKALDMDTKAFSAAVDGFLRDRENCIKWDAHMVFQRLANLIVESVS